MSRALRIVFVCTGNTGRSMAAAALATAQIAHERLPIVVTGRAVALNPGNFGPEAPMAALLARHGIDVSGHRAAALTGDDVRQGDVIVTMTRAHRDTVVARYPEAAAKVVTMAGDVDIADAHAQDLAVYERVFGQITGLVPEVLRKVMRA